MMTLLMSVPLVSLDSLIAWTGRVKGLVGFSYKTGISTVSADITPTRKDR